MGTISSSGRSQGRILELGAGTGFLSCLLAQQGHEVIATDLGEVLGGGVPPLDRLRHNVALSRSHHLRCCAGAGRPAYRADKLDGQIRVESLDWMDAARGLSERPDIWDSILTNPPDTIIAADVVHPPLPALSGRSSADPSGRYTTPISSLLSSAPSRLFFLPRRPPRSPGKLS